MYLKTELIRSDNGLVLTVRKKSIKHILLTVKKQENLWIHLFQINLLLSTIIKNKENTKRNKSEVNMHINFTKC